ncbi:MAG: hypothetical protein V1823_01815 [Chloroflexota bacterium]
MKLWHILLAVAGIAIIAGGITLLATQDKPSLSGEEVSAFVINSITNKQLASNLPTNFETITRNAKYLGDGKWEVNLELRGKPDRLPSISAEAERMRQKLEILFGTSTYYDTYIYYTVTVEFYEETKVMEIVSLLSR